METNVTPKPTRRQRAVAALKRNERKILVVTTVLSTGTAIAMRSTIHQHNVFLRERGLFDEFYGLTEDVTV